jgi:hypothetical protein
MPKLNRTLRTLAVAAGAGAVLLAAVPALAASSSPAPSITGPQVLTGTVYGKAALANAPVIPLKLTGVVTTSSSIDLGGSGPGPGATKTFKTPAGNLTVEIAAKPKNSMTLNPKTCHESYSDWVVVKVAGAKSTGAFAGGSGPGAAEILFVAIAPRFTSGTHKGQCNPNGQPGAKGASATFLGTAVLTTK